MVKSVAVLLGGASPEREISLKTGLGVANALKEMNYNTFLIDPALGSNQYSDENKYFENVPLDQIHKSNYLKSVEYLKNIKPDIAFNALHGKFGEDGSIQNLLELADIPYTGSGSVASSLAMDKSLSKILFRQFDVITPPWFLINDRNYDLNLCQNKIETFFGYPCIVKPVDQGSTIGISICRGGSELQDLISDALNYSNKVLIEKFIDGHEITVGILGKKVLPILEIKPKKKFYDFESKYTDGFSEYIVPANLIERTKEKLEHQALLAYNSVGCEVYGRIDFRVDNHNNTYCLEVNTLPGLTSNSLLPKMAKANDISYNQLIETIINLSLNGKK